MGLKEIEEAFLKIGGVVTIKGVSCAFVKGTVDFFAEAGEYLAGFLAVFNRDDRVNGAMVELESGCDIVVVIGGRDGGKEMGGRIKFFLKFG